MHAERDLKGIMKKIAKEVLFFIVCFIIALIAAANLAGDSQAGGMFVGVCILFVGIRLAYALDARK